MTKAPKIEGRAAPGWEGVQEAFQTGFAKHGEVGAAFAVWHDGQMVVDIWGGTADTATNTPWQRDTLCVLFSVTKGIAATACLMAADRGLLDYDAPIGDYWPELATGSKANMTVRTLLNHRSGLVGFTDPLTIADFAEGGPVLKAMESQEPLWKPGTSQGYHGITFGPYVGELFRRAVGTSLGTFVAKEIAEPLGLDLHIGLPPEHEDRVATLYPVTTMQRLFKALPYVLRNDVVERKLLKALTRKDSATSIAFGSPAELGAKGLHNFNEPRVHQLELPWANGISTARDLCTMYAALANGGELNGHRLVSQSALEPIMRRQSWEPMDQVICKQVGWSQGFIKEEPHLFSPHVEAFGHPGLGGALGYCDPPRKLAWGYVLNKLDFRLRSPRALALSHAVYAALEGK